jgi:(+)-trans-carveol dehydrogenase
MFHHWRGVAVGRVDGKVALVTGGSRGQGRSHALTLAREGAQIVAVDICDQIPSVLYPMSTPEDLAETVRLVEELDQRCIGIQADARDAQQMQDAVDQALAEFGRIDVVVANHGIAHMSGWDTTTSQDFRDAFGVNVIGVFNAIRPVIPGMIEQGGGSIVITASAQGIVPQFGLTAYIASKHAVIGLMRSLSAELGQYSVRANCICPGSVDTPMLNNSVVFDVFTGGKEGAVLDDMAFAAGSMHVLPVSFMEPQVMSNAVLFLASDDAKFITGVAMPVDAGMTNQPPGVPLIATQRIAELEYKVAHPG